MERFVALFDLRRRDWLARTVVPGGAHAAQFIGSAQRIAVGDHYGGVHLGTVENIDAGTADTAGARLEGGQAHGRATDEPHVTMVAPLLRPGERVVALAEVLLGLTLEEWLASIYNADAFQSAEERRVPGVSNNAPLATSAAGASAGTRVTP
ncbi:MAG: hypothetical protein ABI725_05155 [Chloroflexota bacterium]